MFDGLTPDLVPRLFLAAGGVGVAFVVLILVLIFLKRRNSPLFIKGGQKREPRLMVLDAAAVDPKRRLVLVRRDEVEHLIMIGGPTDIVIETGIIERARTAAMPERMPSVDEIASPRAIAVPPAETRPQPVAERRAEPQRPVVPAPVERSAAPPAEARAVAPAVQPVSQPATQPVNRAVAPPIAVPERVAPSADRYVAQPPVERKAAANEVSAMGSVLYGEDREPMTGGRSFAPAPDAQNSAPAATRRTEPEMPVRQPVQQQVKPSAAEAVLDAARSRVLPSPSAAADPVTVADAEKALAARMEAMRRVQSAQPAVTASPTAAQPVAQQAFQSAAQRTEPRIDKPKDAEPSDFEKLLEAELDANGVFGKTPDIRGETRVTGAVAANAAVPPVRVSPPITGATTDVTSEEEVARLLGEIAVNRKS
ncbi:hypothetical protein [Rhizobium sp.]